MFSISKLLFILGLALIVLWPTLMKALRWARRQTEDARAYLEENFRDEIQGFSSAEDTIIKEIGRAMNQKRRG